MKLREIERHLLEDGDFRSAFGVIPGDSDEQVAVPGTRRLAGNVLRLVVALTAVVVFVGLLTTAIVAEGRLSTVAGLLLVLLFVPLLACALAGFAGRRT